MVRLLLRHEAKVNSTTLLAALAGMLGKAQSGFSKNRNKRARQLELLVEILLENGATNINVSGSVFEKTLEAASALGNEKVAKMLREKKTLMLTHDVGTSVVETGGMQSQ